MAIKVVDTLFSKLPKQLGVSSASQAYATDQLLMESSGTVIPATSGTTTLTVLGIGTKTFTEGGSSLTSRVPYIPVATASVFVTADCTNVTAVNQLHKNHVMTDSLNVNNTSTSSTAPAGIFHALGIVGAVGGTKLYGFFTRSVQVTA